MYYISVRKHKLFVLRQHGARKIEKIDTFFVSWVQNIFSWRDFAKNGTKLQRVMNTHLTLIISIRARITAELGRASFQIEQARASNTDTHTRTHSILN